MRYLLSCALLILANISRALILPVEVHGAAGTFKTVTLKVPAGKGASVNRLFLQVHNASYEGKISVQVNGEWTVLSNVTAHVYNPGKAFGGIGGAFAVLKLTVPATAKDGPNSVVLRFNGTDGVSSGFRVVRINFLDAASYPVIPDNSFQKEDPAKWTAPLPGASDIAEGKRLWETAKLVRSPLSKTGIVTCGKCHVANGYDLKYFNYSNVTITERAKFHGLTSKQGRQIASYIRTLSGPAPGRPWNPPYQPGAGIDGKPVTSWAAGAGIDAVLGSDAGLLPYLNFAAKLNLRQIPIALQFPDWNHWLPRIHPEDAWGEEFTQSEFNKHFAVVKQDLTTQSDLASYVKSGAFWNALSGWYNRRQDFLKPRAEDWPADKWTPDHAERVYGTALWHLVKTWELMQQFGLEGYGTDGDERTWYGNALFAASPFMLKIPSTVQGLRGNPLINEYAASIWYAVQLAMNADNQGAPAGQSPVDWAYTYGKLKDMYGLTGYAEPMRLSLILGKAIEVWDKPTMSSFDGWNPHTKADVNRLVHFSFKSMWEQTPADVRRSLMQSLLDKWLAVNKRYTPSQYYAAGFADPLYTPKPWYSGNLGDKVAWMIQEFPVYGVSKAELETWGKTVWPLLGKTGSEGTGD